MVETGELVPAADLLAQLGTVPGLAKVLDRLGYGDAASRGQVAAAAEFVLEGLHLTRRIEKEPSTAGPSTAPGMAESPDERRPVRRPPVRHGRFRYGPWRGGPDPLAPPYDVRAALDPIGDDVLSAGNRPRALRELLRAGLDGRGGLDKLRRPVAQDAGRGPRAAATWAAPSTRSGPLSTRPWPPSRSGWPARTATTPGWPRWSWTTLPDDVAGRRPGAGGLRLALSRGAAAYEPIQQMLRREVLDAQFAGMKQALEARPRGDAGGQGHAGRPQLAAGRARPAARTPPTSSPTSWTSTATSSPSSPRTSTS